MFIQQLSVFLENVKGSLCDMTGVLAEQKVDFMAMSIADTASFGIVRCIVKEAEMSTALDALKAGGYTAKMNHVICVQVPDKPGGLHRILQILQENDLSIEYTYSFFRTMEDHALLVLRLADPQKGLQVLSERGVPLVSQEQINRL